jgi:hypothetical protein
MEVVVWDHEACEDCELEIEISDKVVIRCGKTIEKR